jgi:hypothetical protein
MPTLGMAVTLPGHSLAAAVLLCCSFCCCRRHSRLYTRVLNYYHWVQSCSSFNNTLNNTGLVGIQASCEPNKAQQMLDIMCSEYIGLYRLGYTCFSTPCWHNKCILSAPDGPLLEDHVHVCRSLWLRDRLWTCGCAPASVLLNAIAHNAMYCTACTALYCPVLQESWSP